MNRTTTWKTLAVGALLGAMSVTGIATAQAAPAAPAPASVTGTTTDCTTGGAHAEKCTTSGSTAIHTWPRTTAEAYSVNQDLLRNPQAD